MHIALVVENAEDAELLQIAARKHDYEVVELVTSIKALRAVLKTTAADILVFALEHIDHRQLRQIERIYLGHPCPIIMFTRQGDAPIINAALKAGISACIVDGLWPERVKPIMDVAIIRFNETQLLRQAADILMKKAHLSWNGTQQALPIASPFFAKPEMGPSDFGSEKLATSMASGGPRTSCVRHGATLRCAP